MKQIEQLEAELDAALARRDAARAEYESAYDADWIALKAAEAEQTAKLAALAEYDTARDAAEAAEAELNAAQAAQAALKAEMDAVTETK